MICSTALKWLLICCEALQLWILGILNSFIELLGILKRPCLQHLSLRHAGIFLWGSLWIKALLQYAIPRGFAYIYVFKLCYNAVDVVDWRVRLLQIKLRFGLRVYVYSRYSMNVLLILFNLHVWCLVFLWLLLSLNLFYWSPSWITVSCFCLALTFSSILINSAIILNWGLI